MVSSQLMISNYFIAIKLISAIKILGKHEDNFAIYQSFERFDFVFLIDRIFRLAGW